MRRLLLLSAMAFVGVTLAAHLAVAQLARPEAPTTVANVKWGASVTDVQRAHPNASCQLDHDKDYSREKADSETRYDMERGLLTTVTPVKFSAVCVLTFDDGEKGQGTATLDLVGNPPRLYKAYVTYQRPDYARMRQVFIDVYGPPKELRSQHPGGSASKAGWDAQ